MMGTRRTIPWIAFLAGAVLCGGLALTSIDGLVERGTALGAKESPAPPGAMRPRNTPTVASPAAAPVATAGVADGAAAADDAGTGDPALPGARERLLEQIETARQGLAVAQASGTTGAASPSTPSRWSATSLAMLGAGLAFIAGATGLAIAAARRKKKGENGTAPARTASAPARAATSRGAAAAPRDSAPVAAAAVPAWTAVAQAAPAVSVAAAVPRAAVPAPAPVMAAEAIEARMRGLERSMLQLARTMEEMAARTESIARAQESLAAERAAEAPSATWSSAAAFSPPLAPAGPHGEPHAGSPGGPRRAIQDERRDEPHDELHSEAASAGAGTAPGTDGRLAGFGRTLTRTQRLQPREPWDLGSAEAPAPREDRQAPAATAGRPATAAGTTAPASRPAPRLAPPASTIDGRDLVRIRQAVIRLAAEGWDAGRIARQLRLGTGVVELILKSSNLPPVELAAEAGRR